MSTINDGGPAFPSTQPAQDFGAGGTLPAYHQDGMTLRAYFAAHALQGMLSHPCNTPIPEIVTTSVEIADAMIAAMERKA